MSESNPKNWDLSFSSTGPVIKCIPKASRVQACKNFSEILNDIITKNDVKSWLCLLQYPRYCFGGTVRGGTKTKNQATIINKRIDVYLKETPKLEKHLPRKTAPSLKDQVSTRLNLADVSGTVRVISSSDTVLPPSREVRNKLEEKHPPLRFKITWCPSCDTECVTSTKEEVKRAIKSFKPGSSGGPDGLLPQQLQDLTSDDIGEPAVKLWETLCNFFNKIIFPDNDPSQMCSILHCANLIALSKPCGGVRQIAVGLTLRRLVGKIVMKKLYGKCKNLFLPNQLGVGTPKGIDSVVDTVRAYIQNEKNTRIKFF